MYLVWLAALTAVCSAEKLDRTYLPPATAKTAGGSPGSLQTPFSDYHQGPAGSYSNDAQGIVVDAASPGTRTSIGSEESGLGAPRTSYGSTASKVGEAAFKDSLTGFNKYPTLLKSIPLEDQDPEYQTSIPKQEAIQTKLLLPQDKDHNSNIVTYENNVDVHKYNYGFESNNGIAVGEKGVAHDGVDAQGGYSYKGDDRKVYKVTYTADKAGYQPQGEHLPTPHPVSEDIHKAIDKSKKEESAGTVDKGSYDSQKYNAEGDYKESDTNKYQTQQSQFEKRPEYDAPVNGASLVEYNVPTSGLTSGSTSGSSVNQAVSAVTTGSSSVFSSQSKPSIAFDQGPLGNSPSFSQFLQGSSFKPGIGTQFTQQGLKPEYGSPILSHFGAFPTIQPGQYESKFNTQTFHKPEHHFASSETSQHNKDKQVFSNIPTSYQYSQGHQDAQSNTHFVSSDAPNYSKPTIPVPNKNSKPFGSSFGSTTSNFGQVDQTGSLSNAYLPPSPNNVNEKPLHSVLPQETSISTTPITSSKNPANIPLSINKQDSQLNQHNSFTTSSATVIGPTPALGFQAPQVPNVYQQPSNIHPTKFTPTTDNKFSSPQGQASVDQSIQKYPQQSSSQNPQQQKPLAALQSPSSSSSLFTQTAFNQSPPGPTPTTSQSSMFDNQFSNTPVTIQTSPPTSPFFTYSYSPSNEPLSPLVLTSQQVTEKDKLTQSITSNGHKLQSESSQSKPSTTQSVFSTQLPVSGQQSQGVDNLYYYNQPAKPFSTPATSSQVSAFPLSSFSQHSKQSKPSQPLYTSVTQEAPALLPSQSPTLSTSFLQKPAQQIFSQSSSQKPTTSEVSQLGQTSLFTSPINNKPLGIFQYYVPQPSPTQQHTGELYDYKKPIQGLSATANKDSAISEQKPKDGQILSVGTSTGESDQSDKETTSHLESIKPQIGQNPLQQQGNTQSSNTPVTSQGQSKPGSIQFNNQSYKPFGSTSQFGSQPLKPFTTATQFGTQSFKPSGSTTSFGTQSYKPFGTTTQFGTQPVKTAASSFQFGRQPTRPFGSTSQFGTQQVKPSGNTFQFGTQQAKPSESTFQLGAQEAKPSISTSQFGIQQAKPTGSTFQLGTQQAKPSGSTFQLGSQEAKPSISTSQFGTQQAKPSGNTFQLGTQQAKPSESISHFGTQQAKPSESTFQLGSQEAKPSISTSQFGTQQAKPSGNTFQLGTQQAKPSGSISHFGTQQAKPSGNTFQFGIQQAKPSESTSQFGNEKAKPFGSTFQLGTQQAKPSESTSQFGTQQAKPSGNTFQFGTQQAKPSESASQFGTQQAKPSESTFQLGAQEAKPSISTSQFGIQQAKPTGSTFQLGTQEAKPSISTSQFGTQQAKPSGNTFQLGTQQAKPSESTSQFGTQQAKPSESTSQFVAQHAKPSGNTFQFGIQQAKPSESTSQFGYEKATPSGSTLQFGTQQAKPYGTTSQFSTEQAKPSGSTFQFSAQQARPSGSSFQIGTQQAKPYESTLHLEAQSHKPQVSQPQQLAHEHSQPGTVTSTHSEFQPIKHINNIPLTTTSQTLFGAQTTKPQFSPQGQNYNAGTVSTSQFGTQPQVSQSTFGAAQTTSSQVQSSKIQQSIVHSVKPLTPHTEEQQAIQQQSGIQSKPQFSQTYLTASKNPEQSVPQNQFVAPTYKPLSTVPSSSSGSFLTQSQSEIQDTKPHDIPEKGGNINVGAFNAVPSVSTIQGTVQTTNLQSSKTQFGGELTKPVKVTQTQQHEFGAQSKPQFPQSQQTHSINQQQPNVNNAFGSQSYNAFESSTPYNFGAQQTKNQFGQNNFPNFGGTHATASASSQPFPDYRAGSQLFENTFNSQFAQNFLASQNSAFASATSGPEPYEYNKPTPQPFIQFSGQPGKYFGGISTPVFPSVQPQFGHPTTPSYTQKLSSFESVQGSSTFGQSSSPQFSSQTIKPLGTTQFGVIPQALPAKPQSSLGAACCKATQSAQLNHGAPSFGSSAKPTVQSSIHGQTPQTFTLQGPLKPEERPIKGEKFNGTKQPQRFDEKTGYHY